MGKTIESKPQHPESNHKSMGREIAFSCGTKDDLLENLSAKETKLFTQLLFGLEYFSHVAHSTAHEAEQISKAKIVPLGGLAKNYKEAVMHALKGGKNLRVSDYGQAA